MYARQKVSIPALSVLGLIAASAAQADMSPCATLYASNPGTVCTGSPVSLNVPGTYSYSDTALKTDTASGGLITGSNYSAPGQGPYNGASFYDAYVFTISGAQADTISSTLTLPSSTSPNGFSISGFEERLYALPNSKTTTAPYVGGIPSPSALEAWTFPLGTSGTVAVLGSPTPVTLGAGTYALEVRGDVTGMNGGSYSGTLQLEPVPLPAALPLLLSGFGLIGGGGLMRRRSGAVANG
jgi:hypothetical protein